METDNDHRARTADFDDAIACVQLLIDALRRIVVKTKEPEVMALAKDAIDQVLRRR